MAQLGSALDWGSRGRRFKSCQPDRLCRSTGLPESREGRFSVFTPKPPGTLSKPMSPPPTSRSTRSWTLRLSRSYLLLLTWWWTPRSRCWWTRWAVESSSAQTSPLRWSVGGCAAGQTGHRFNRHRDHGVGHRGRHRNDWRTRHGTHHPNWLGVGAVGQGHHLAYGADRRGMSCLDRHHHHHRIRRQRDLERAPGFQLMVGHPPPNSQCRLAVGHRRSCRKRNRSGHRFDDPHYFGVNVDRPLHHSWWDHLEHLLFGDRARLTPALWPPHLRKGRFFCASPGHPFSRQVVRTR